MSFHSLAAPRLSEAAFYNRCFSQLTNRPVPLKDTTLIQIKEGKIRSLDACLDLLKQAELNSNGVISAKESEAKFSKNILNTFYNLHRTWFPTSTVDQILGYRNEFDSKTQDTVEFSSPALALTYSLFNKSPVRNIFSGNEDHYALRGVQDISAMPMSEVSGISPPPAKDMQRLTPSPALFFGDLFGIKKLSLAFNLDNYSVGALTIDVATDNSKFDLSLPVNQFKHFGGGILGQQSFFLLNSGHPKGTIFDGAAKLPRKWAKTAVESLLCLSLPTLREDDVLNLVNTASKVSFRNHSSCMTCHATMDPFAATARNLIVAETEPDLNGAIDKSIFVSSFNVTLPSTEIFASAAVPNYNKQQPTGRLFYRSFHSGELINQDVQNIEDMGKKLAETEEFYQCLSKRYFQYFTGINVSLYDTRDKKNQDLNLALTERDKQDRKFIEFLGAELRTSQSLSRIIELILRSDYYMSPTFKMEEK